MNSVPGHTFGMTSSSPDPRWVRQKVVLQEVYPNKKGLSECVECMMSECVECERGLCEFLSV